MRKHTPRIFLLLTILTVSLTATIIAPSGRAQTSTARMYVWNPQTDSSSSTAPPGGNFNVTINIADVVDLFAWQTRFMWDASLLELTKVTQGDFLKGQPEGTWFIQKINQTFGFVDIFVTTVGDHSGVSGRGILATLNFRVDGGGSSDLNLTQTLLMDHILVEMPHIVENGDFSNTIFHDIAVTGVSLSKTRIEAGEIVYINVTVLNDGDYTETFNVTVSYDETVIEMKTNITLPAKTETTPPLAFVWDTTGLSGGDYIITAQASKVPKEADVLDNILTDGTVHIPLHDVAITSLTTSETQVTSGQSISVSVTAKNKGDFTESFNVALYYDSTPLGTQSVTNLEPNATKELAFTWDTTGIPEGAYLLKAVADTVPEETHTKDNTYTTHYQNAIEIRVSGVFIIPPTLIGSAVVAAAVIAVVVFYLFRRRSSAPA